MTNEQENKRQPQTLAFTQNGCWVSKESLVHALVLVSGIDTWVAQINYSTEQTNKI